MPKREAQQSEKQASEKSGYRNIHLKFPFWVHKTLSDGWAGALSIVKGVLHFVVVSTGPQLYIFLLLIKKTFKTPIV
jgi:hypothetical protein